MSGALSTRDLPRHVAAACLLVLPVAFLYSRAVSEILMAIIVVFFLGRCAVARDWRWVRKPWIAAALAFWAWIILCSAVDHAGRHAIVQSIVSVRYFLFVAALEAWVLAGANMRRWIGWAVAACGLWVALQCWEQYLTGTNIFGDPRWIDGALTGPFFAPRAGPVFVLILYPAMLPAAVWLLTRPKRVARAGGVLLTMLGIGTLVLIGQRMPALLGALGLVVSGLLLPRFRPAMFAALATGAVLLAATPLISPATHEKLVVHFSNQMEHFSGSAYGQIYIRAAVMAAEHPLLGLGFDGFRTNCDNPAYAGAVPALHIPAAMNDGTEACNQHPHNFYLEAATNGGAPGLVLFALMAALWWLRAADRLWGSGDAMRVALFVTLLGALWPLASTSEFFSIPTAGWLFLVAGWAFAERGALPVRAQRNAMTPAKTGHEERMAL